MNLKFDITLKEYKIVLDILHKYLKTPAKIWVFGSRAKHKTKHNSDLDIAIESSEAIPLGILADLEEAFTDASLPYTVDIVELNRVKTEFQNIINQHKVLLTIIGNIPKLRFPEFRDEGEWSTKLVEDYFKVGSSKRVLQKDWKDSGVPFYRTRELVSLSKNESFRSEIFISEDLFEELSNKYGIPLKGDFLVSGVGTLGISYQVKDKDRFYFKDGNVIWFKTKSNIIPDYFNYCFQSQFVQNQILGRSSASTVGTYTIQNAKKTKFWMPYCKSEQQKIAACLTALDDLISAATGRLDALKRHKQGLKQQLFPAEGETVPRLRFPEFRDAGEWESKKLDDNDVSSFVKEKLPLSGIIRENYVSTENILPDFGGITTAAKLPPSGSFTAYRRGDILIANIRPYLKKIWVANRNGGASNDIIVVRSKRSNSFLSFILKNGVFINYVMQGAKGVKMPRGDIKLIKRYPISVPELKEQQKIAACLTALDDLIAAQTQKIAKLKMHKRGLMQQLFPAVDETHQ